MPRSALSDSGWPPGVFSQAVMPLKFGAGPQFTSVVAVELQLDSVVCAVPVRALSCLRILARALEGGGVAGDVALEPGQDV